MIKKIKMREVWGGEGERGHKKEMHTWAL